MTQPSDDEQALLAACVAATDTAIAVVDAGGADLPLVYVNAAFERVTGYGTTDASGGGGRFLGGTRDPESTDAVLRALRAGRPAHARLLTARPDGSTYWNEVHATPVRDDSGNVTHFISVQQDNTEQVAAETRSAYAATHDSLTGLANRAHFAEHLERELARARRDGRSLAVLFLDVDDLKAANDSYGHAVGDALLIEVAHRLGTRLRGQDMAARHGGDEFLAMLVDLPGDGADGAGVVADELGRALAGNLEIDGSEHRLSISIGIALFPRDAGTAAALVAHADAAMYRAKAGPATGGVP